MTDIEKIDEITELEAELKKWELKLKIQKAKLDFQSIKQAMNTPDPEPKAAPPLERF
jgi:hypothetical protein